MITEHTDQPTTPNTQPIPDIDSSLADEMEKCSECGEPYAHGDCCLGLCGNCWSEENWSAEKSLLKPGSDFSRLIDEFRRYEI